MPSPALQVLRGNVCFWVVNEMLFGRCANPVNTIVGSGDDRVYQTTIAFNNLQVRTSSNQLLAMRQIALRCCFA